MDLPERWASERKKSSFLKKRTKKLLFVVPEHRPRLAGTALPERNKSFFR
jgi:hypothetical protein